MSGGRGRGSRGGDGQPRQSDVQAAANSRRRTDSRQSDRGATDKAEIRAAVEAAGADSKALPERSADA